MGKSGLQAFFLSFIPGLGHYYLGRKIKAVLFATGFFGSVFCAFAMAVISRRDDPVFFFIFIAIFFWAISMLDSIVTILRNSRFGITTDHQDQSDVAHLQTNRQQNERFYTILLSFIPGLGHFQLGLMQRGVTFLIMFFGVLAMVVFVTALTHQEGFLVFLAALPIIWLYSLFDAVQLVNRKQQGEDIVDRSIFEELERNREEGRKSKVVATLLSVFPGAGHMYLGLQRRGLQLMVAFLFSIYILDILRLSIFLFLIPIIWFYSFFDSLQHVSRHGQGEIADVPFVNWLLNHQKWIGLALLGLGLFYLLQEGLIPIAQIMLPTVKVGYWFHTYFQTVIVSILLIGGGIKLLLGSNRKKADQKREGGDLQ